MQTEVAPAVPLELRAKAELERRKRLKRTAWPAVYTNAVTGKVYVPHNSDEQIFVLDDKPRYMALIGGEGCVSGDTLIGGIPIAERVTPGQAPSVWGPAMAEAAYLKGQDDLFRVKADDGEVVCTRAHRFLTPAGWKPLSLLKVGAMIAAESGNGQQVHPVFMAATLPQLLQLSNNEDFSYIDESRQWPYLLWTEIRSIEFERHGDYYDIEVPSTGCYLAGGLLHHNSGKTTAGLVKVFSRLRRGLDGVCACVAGSTLVGGIPIAERKSPGIVPSYPGKALASRGYLKGSADLWRVVVKPANSKRFGTHCTARWRAQVDCTAKHVLMTPTGWQPLELLRVGDLLLSNNEDFSYMDWGAIDSITWAGYGEYYDLSVPVTGCYWAAGLLHHNSPDLPHFIKSLWPEFVAWCPWEQVIERQRYRGLPGWEPHGMFTMVFYTEAGKTAKLYCGGMAEEDIESWMGANLNFAYVDEIRRHRSAIALKVLDGRIRKEGSQGEPPQLWFTTVPRMNWLYEYFGPLQPDDPFADFKRDSFVGRLRTEDNRINLAAGYVEQRRQTLTESESRLFLDAEWEDEADTSRFLSSILWWDACQESLPPLRRDEPLVLAADAATGGLTTLPDTFALVGVTRHPDRPNDIAIRYVQAWSPPAGGLLDFLPIEEEIKRLCETFAVVEIAYDKTELHDMMMRIQREGIALVRSFSQGADREVADKQLLDLIASRRIAHAGDPVLRKHISNADVKKTRDAIRITKRTNSLKVDLAVALSMATSRCLYYNLG